MCVVHFSIETKKKIRYDTQIIGIVGACLVDRLRATKRRMLIDLSLGWNNWIIEDSMRAWGNLSDLARLLCCEEEYLSSVFVSFRKVPLEFGISGLMACRLNPGDISKWSSETWLAIIAARTTLSVRFISSILLTYPMLDVG